jgi:hypothetical protein
MQNMSQQQRAMMIAQLNESAHQALVESARNEVFEIKQTAENALASANERPVQALAALRWQRLRMIDIGLTPELFRDLGDKEYCAQTTRMIQAGEQQLTRILSPADQNQATEMAQMALRLPDYKYYVDNYHPARSYREAKGIYDDKKNRRFRRPGTSFNYSFIGKIVAYGAMASLALSPFVCAATLDGSPAIGLLLWPILALSGWYYWKQSQRFTEFQGAKALAESLKDKVDLKQFETLERRFGTNYQQVSFEMANMEAKLESFFNAPGRQVIISEVARIPERVEPAPPTPICANCQTELPGKSKFCHKCGHPTS